VNSCASPPLGHWPNRGCRARIVGWVDAEGLPPEAELASVFNVKRSSLRDYSNAFGLGARVWRAYSLGLAALNLAVASILVGFVLQRATPRLSSVGFAFITAGATGNALDRIRFGTVIDLFDASKLGLIWIFNVADVSIDAGIALLLLAILSRSGSDRI
jgi:lipoprotein signal peptidase